MLFADRNGERVRATLSGDRGTCLSCGADMIAKCGALVVWHWAHASTAECDTWAEESAWHLRWKLALEARGAQIEVPMGPHRADAVLPDGRIVELQHSQLSPGAIAEREAFYGEQLVWLWDAERWMDRLHFGRHGFWWKRGSPAMARSRRPVWWDTGDELWRVSIDHIERKESGYGFALDAQGEPTGTPHVREFVVGRRVVGKILERRAPAVWP